VEFIEQYVKAHGVRGIAQATYYPTQAARAIAKRTGAKIILLCQSVGEAPEAPDYLAMVSYNVRQLAAALHAEATP